MIYDEVNRFFSRDIRQDGQSSDPNCSNIVANPEALAKLKQEFQRELQKIGQEEPTKLSDLNPNQLKPPTK